MLTRYSLEFPLGMNQVFLLLITFNDKTPAE